MNIQGNHTMRCTHCDLPLSPTSTAGVCPRCHMPVETGINTAAKAKHASLSQPPSWGDGIVAPSWQGHAEPVIGTSQPGTPPPSSSFPTSQQTPFPQPGQMWLPTPTPTPLPGIAGAQFSAREIREDSRPLPQERDMPWESRQLLHTTNAHMHQTRKARMVTSNVGFIVAGACVLTGALLLILVYFLAAGLSPSIVQTQSMTAGNSVTATTRQHTPTAVPTHITNPSPTVPSGAFPAQQYVSNPQMASAVNPNTAQVIQAATTFKVGQRVYVAFTIHPNGRSGAICLQWYANAQAFSHFEFAISPSSTVAYSYTYYATPGAAYVQIYWASSVSCNDEMLAQRINFTVVK